MTLKIYLLDTNYFPVNILLNSPCLNEIDKLDLNRYKIEQVYNEHIASTYLKRKYIGEYHIDDNGKPLSNKCYFNISHSHGVVVLVVDSVPVGVDIELIRPVEDDLKRFVTSEEEYIYIKDEQSFYEIWTSKESLLKAVGTGLKDDLKTTPGLPIKGIKQYKDNIYYINNIKYQNYIISTSRKGDQNYEIEIVMEELL